MHTLFYNSLCIQVKPPVHNFANYVLYKDPEAKKPEDWVDNAKMDDPEDTKPEDWDKPEHIADPDATKPDDWDDEMDGEWEPPQIDNPEYKGEWKPKQIDNPDYKVNKSLHVISAKECFNV